MTNRRKGGKRSRPPKTQAQRNVEQMPPPQTVQRPALSAVTTAVKVELLVGPSEKANREAVKRARD